MTSRTGNPYRVVIAALLLALVAALAFATAVPAAQADSADITVTVELKDSLNAGISGGVVKYYSGGWKSFGTTNGSGVATKDLPPGTYNFRMTYAGGTEEQKGIDVSVINPLVFQTVKMVVQLKDSSGAARDTGLVKYYASGWKTFGSTSLGEVSKELLPLKYNFRMTYEGGTQEKKSIDVSSTNPLVFQTVNMVVQLKDSLGALQDAGSIKYYAGGWKIFGTTSGGQASKELLPLKYNFRMTYEGGTQEKKSVDVSSTNPLVFQTVLMTVQLKDSFGAALDTGYVRYYASGWRTFGTTSGGQVSKELLPLKYNFRMTYEGGTQEKKSIDVTVTNPLLFTTENMIVKLQKCDSSGIAGGKVKYYASGWKNFGTTVANGEAAKQLLPLTYNFRMTHAGATREQKSINISATNPLLFTTTEVTLAYDGVIKYYASGWKTFVQPTMDLLPGTYSFRFGSVQTKLVISGCSMEQSAVVVKLLDHSGAGLNGGKVGYYWQGWKYPGYTGDDGAGRKVVLIDGLVGASDVTFNMTWNGVIKKKTQNLSSDVVFQTVAVKARLQDSDGAGVAGGKAYFARNSYLPMGTTDASGETAAVELLPLSDYYFQMIHYGQVVEYHPYDLTTVGSEHTVVFNTSTVCLQFSDTIRFFRSGGSVYTFTKPCMELFPGDYTFRFTKMNYPNADLPLTVPVSGTIEKSVVYARLTDSGGGGLAGGEFDYRFGYNPYVPMGSTNGDGVLAYGIDGFVTNTKFRVKYAGGTTGDKQQNIAVDSFVEFQTVPVTAVLNDSFGNPLGGASFKYRYSFNPFQTFTSPMELLPISTKIKVTYEGASVEKQQNVGSDPDFVFSTVPVTAVLEDSSGVEIPGTVDDPVAFTFRYSFNPSQTFTSPMELLPVSTKITVHYAGASVEKPQNVGTNPDFVFNTVSVTAVLKDSSGGEILSTAADPITYEYRYSYGPYETFTSPMELLPVNTKVTVYYRGASVEELQDVGTDALFEFQTGSVKSVSDTCTDYRYGYGQYMSFTNPMELLPVNTKFTFNDGTPETSEPVTAGTETEIH